MPRRILQGVVVSDKSDKTITVKVEQRMADKRMGKIIRRSKKFRAHDEANTHKTGDVVRILECRPISKHKNWVVLEQDGKAKKPAPKKDKAPAQADTAPKAEEAPPTGAEQ